MRAEPLRLIVAAAAVAVLVGAGVVLVVQLIAGPRPTPFGWPATMTTAAGSGERGFADGARERARFSDPFAVAVDRRGAVYVADAGGTGRIRKVATDGRVSTLPGVFDTPSGVAVGRDGTVYVAETGANRIRAIHRDGTVATLAGDGTAGFRDGAAAQARFNGPIGVAVDKAGDVYVADTYNDRIRVITPGGRVKTLAGGAAPGFADGAGAGAAFDTPCGIAVGHDGALFIADTGNNAVRRLGKDGVVTTLARAAPDDFRSALRAPIGIAVTRDGSLYVAGFRGGRIVELSPRGALRILTGQDAWLAQNRNLTLARPAGLALDNRGALYVAEAARFAIRKLSPRRPGDPAPATTPQLASSPPALTRAAVVPWPIAPQMSWHEVVGDMGEVRGDYHGDSRDHLHAGLDVHADVGATVLAIADETVESPLPASALDSLSENLQIDQVRYVHMRVGRTSAGAPLDPARFQFVRDAAGKLVAVRVKRGTRFRVGDALGSVNAMAHVHLELAGGEANPIRLKFPGLSDHFAPRIQSIAIYDAAWRPLDARRDGRLIVPRDAGPLSIVVDAWDQVDGDEPRRRLGLYRLGFQVLGAGGAPVKGYERPQITLEFDRIPEARDAAKIAYAPASGDAVHTAQPTSFLYVVTNHVRGGRAEVVGWRPAALAPGEYTIRVFAADYAGNVATDGRDLAIRIQ